MIYIFDSNAIIDYLSTSLPSKAMVTMHRIVDQGFFVSVITKIETLGFASGNTKVDSYTKSFVNLGIILELGPDIVQKTIDIKRIKKMKTPDAIIAATAIVHGLTLLSRNLKDFTSIQGLMVIDPHTL